MGAEPKPLMFVRIGVYLQKFAIIESATGEPLQYLTRQIADAEAFRDYAMQIAESWEEIFATRFEQSRLCG